MTRPRVGARHSRRWLTTTFAVGAIDVRLWLRHKASLLVLIALPLAAIVVVTGTLRSPPQRSRWAIVDEDHGAVGVAFRSELRSRRIGIEVTSTSVTRRIATDLLRAKKVDAVVTIPDGVTETLGSGQRPPELEVQSFEKVRYDLARVVAEEFWTRVWLASRSGSQPTGTDTQTVHLTRRVALVPVVGETARLDASIGLFFVMLGLGFAIQRHVESRESGVLDRVRSSAAPATAAVIGRALGGVALGGISLAASLGLALVVTNTRADPVALGALCVVTLLAYAGIAATLAAVARTAEQALLISALAGVTMAFGSGAFSGSGAAPVWGALLPSARALHAFVATATSAGHHGLVANFADFGVLVMTGIVGLASGAFLEGRP